MKNVEEEAAEVFLNDEAAIETSVPEKDSVTERRQSATLDRDQLNDEWELDDEIIQERPLSTKESIRIRCCPYGRTRHAVPLAFCLIALVLTFAGSWHCNYFRGANISFTGDRYGLWTMEDIAGKCQLWDVLFFSYELGAPLIWARVFSMTAMLLGLGLLTTMSQALQFHFINWAAGVCMVALFIASVLTTNVFNVWIIFWLFTYVIVTLIVRFLFIHPVHRRISRRGTRVVIFVQVVCSLSSILTLVVLKSDFCTCRNLTEESLEGRDPGNVCDASCELSESGILMIVACPLWLLGAWGTARFGIQPEQLPRLGTEHLYDNYPRNSIASRVMEAMIPSRSFKTDSGATPSEETEAVHDTEGGILKEAERTSEPVDDGTNVPRVDDDDVGSIDDEEVHDEEHQHRRTCCQKTCFDYRVSPRSKKESFFFWAFRVLLGVLVVVYVFIVIVLIGSRVENTNAAKSPGTSQYFILDEVCAYNPLDPSQSFETFPTKQEANEAGYLVAHCGACGSCSNPNDIQDYVTTRKTVAKKAKKCGIHAILGKYSKLVGCLEDEIGFSRPCTQCWADNMKRTASNCLFTCMSTTFQGLMGTNNIRGAGDDGWLNSCLFCDERRSGPGFATCSGVARRRLGIASEINRNPKEVCNNTDVDWLRVEWSLLFSE